MAFRHVVHSLLTPEFHLWLGFVTGKALFLTRHCLKIQGTSDIQLRNRQNQRVEPLSQLNSLSFCGKLCMNDLRTMYGIAFKICVDIATPTQLGRRASHSNNGENSCSSVLGTTYATAICTVRPVCSAKSDNRFGGESVKMAHDNDHDPSKFGASGCVHSITLEKLMCLCQIIKSTRHCDMAKLWAHCVQSGGKFPLPGSLTSCNQLTLPQRAEVIDAPFLWGTRAWINQECGVSATRCNFCVFTRPTLA